MDKKGLGGVALLLFASIFGGFFFVTVLQHQVAVQENTAEATATVEATDVDVKTDDEGDESYSPIVEYEYTVDGETYTNDNVFPGGFQRWRDDRSWAQSVVSEYSVGEEATVSYNPDEPARAYLRNDGPPWSWIVSVVYAVIAIFGGVWLVRTGIRRRKQRTLIKDTPTEEVESLSIGTSEIKGNAVISDLETLRAPFSEDDCVIAEYEVEEYHDNDDEAGGSWRTVEIGVLHTPFYVDDGTGRVLVEPDDEATYDLDPEDETTVYVDSSEKGPEPVRRFVETEDIGFPADRSGKDNDRRYRQNLILPEESVYVFGTVERRDGVSSARNEDALVVGGDGALEDEMFMISDDEEADLIERREWALWRLPVGGLFLVVALAVFLVVFGPVVGVTLPVYF
ncbi:MAG: DUF3592 domain-containing protein [Halobacteria archaeon]